MSKSNTTVNTEEAARRGFVGEKLTPEEHQALAAKEEKFRQDHAEFLKTFKG